MSSFVLLLLVGMAASVSAAPVQYVRVCSSYGTGFLYLPGTDTCWNPATGDIREETIGGTWRSLWPYPEGTWDQAFERDCLGRIVHVGDFASTDFSLNAYNKKETAPFPLVLPQGQFITKVIMSGGFYDPRTPSQGGSNSIFGLCLRGRDPTLYNPALPPSASNPDYGNGMLPIGCIANNRIVNMPRPYSVNATAAYPQTYSFFPTEDQTVIAGPFTYGRQLVVGTDITLYSDSDGPLLLTYHDSTNNTDEPLAGTLSVWVCVGGTGFAKP
ncbi:MAG TPA: porin [Thermoanaerobaculia bacterium]|nr:porin [Thermoanaerobaculia bacterium]